jgi:hypothetical protein
MDLKELLNNLDINNEVAITQFIEACEKEDTKGTLYLAGLKKLYLERIAKIDNILLSEDVLTFTQKTKLNPMYRYSKLEIYAKGLEKDRKRDKQDIAETIEDFFEFIGLG